MADKIRVLIVDDLPETRENVRKLLQFEPDVEVVGQAGTGDQAIELSRKHQPDVILMDINMPGTDGIRASREITQTVPAAQVIIMSVQSEADYLRRAMLAGARDFLMKPFSGEELITAVRRVYETRPARAPIAAAGQVMAAGAASVKVENGNVIAVFSPKGGTGCTTLAVNMAVSMAQSGLKTLLIDASLQFGGVDVMLNMKTATSIIDLIENLNDLDADLLSSVFMTHEESGLKVLLAPPRPEMAELVLPEHITPLFAKLRAHFEYIIVDTTSNLSPMALAVLDSADKILLVAQQNLPTLKNVSRFFNLAEELEYERDKVLMVINRESTRYSISTDRIANILKRPILATVPLDDDSTQASGDKGKPLMSSEWSRLPIAQSLQKLGQKVTEVFSEEGGDAATAAAEAPKKRRLFGFG